MPTDIQESGYEQTQITLQIGEGRATSHVIDVWRQPQLTPATIVAVEPGHYEIAPHTLALSLERALDLAAKRSTSSNIERAIVASRGILELDDNWDDEDSLGYSEPTWNRAAAFLRNQAAIDPNLPVPMISPADSGSIDLYWRLVDRTLLINFPADGSEASYFGKGSGRGTTSGRLSGTGGRSDLAAWLTQP